jgi:hypothetical protein
MAKTRGGGVAVPTSGRKRRADEPIVFSSKSNTSERKFSTMSSAKDTLDTSNAEDLNGSVDFFTQPEVSNLYFMHYKIINFGTSFIFPPALQPYPLLSNFSKVSQQMVPW